MGSQRVLLQKVYQALVLIEVNAPVEVICNIWSVIFESYCVVEVAATLKVCDDFVFNVQVITPLLDNFRPISCQGSLKSFYMEFSLFKLTFTKQKSFILLVCVQGSLFIKFLNLQNCLLRQIFT